VRGRYIDERGRVLFVSSDPNGRTFGVYYVGRTGSLKRLVSKHLPERESRLAAEADLRLWCEAYGCRAIDAAPITR
jgi:hypothetical protein